VAIVATPHCLRFAARNDHIAVAYEEAGEFSPAEISIPLSFLALCEGSRVDSVELTSTSVGSVRASWIEECIDQTRIIDSCEPPPDLPPLPETLITNPTRLLSALRDAADTTDAGSVRYALGCIQIRGLRGEIVATDGRQLFVERGFQFPFEDDILIGHHQVFAASELLAANQVSVGIRDGWFALRAGGWAVQIKIETEGRFPRADDVIPSIGHAVASCRLSPADCNRLVRALPLLPGNDEQDAPVTVDFDERFAIHAKSSIDGRASELTLDGHEPHGLPLRIAVDRRYLQRVGKFGLTELHLFSSRTPLHACDDLRSYIWMPLAESAMVAPVLENEPVARAAA